MTRIRPLTCGDAGGTSGRLIAKQGRRPQLSTEDAAAPQSDHSGKGALRTMVPRDPHCNLFGGSSERVTRFPRSRYQPVTFRTVAA